MLFQQFQAYGENAVKFESLVVEPLTKTAFAPFGDVIEIEGAELRLINNGTTERYHDLARVEAAGTEARVLVNIFRGQSFVAPIDIVMMERHPYGSQAFIPLNGRPFLVVVAEDADGKPATPRVFRARGDQGVNYLRNVWHHPLLALEQKSDFLVVDRAGREDNLEEFFFSSLAYRIETDKPA
nr:ureidoglycolate lyase [Ochrobactrum sp. CM-21-5]